VQKNTRTGADEAEAERVGVAHITQQTRKTVSEGNLKEENKLLPNLEGTDSGRAEFQSLWVWAQKRKKRTNQEKKKDHAGKVNTPKLKTIACVGKPATTVGQANQFIKEDNNARFHVSKRGRVSRGEKTTARSILSLFKSNK